VIVDHPDRPKPKPIGIVTDRDIVVSALARTDRHLGSVLAADVMSADPETVAQNEDLEVAVKRMRSAGVRRLPVVDGSGHLVGIIGLDDVIDLFQEQLADLSALLSNEMRRERSERG
jgi:CBS domain-containing protein